MACLVPSVRLCARLLLQRERFNIVSVAALLIFDDGVASVSLTHL